MSTINDTDQFLVQRGSTSYKQSAVDLMSTIQDTDLMLIQRGTESFKVTCEDVKDQLGGGGASAPVLDSVTLAQNPPVDANRYTGKLFTTTTTASGGVASTLEMTGTVTGALGIKAGSNPITANAYPGTSSTSVVLTLEGETNLGDLIEVGNTVTANVSYTPETDTIQSAESIQYSRILIGMELFQLIPKRFLTETLPTMPLCKVSHLTTLLKLHTQEVRSVNLNSLSIQLQTIRGTLSYTRQMAMNTLD